MSNGISIKRGANINLRGEAEKFLTEAKPSKTFALKPDNFFGIVPRLLVKEGDLVAKGAPIFHAKHDPRILFVSPVSGIVKEILRGSKRKILHVIIENKNDSVTKHDINILSKLDRSTIVEILLNSGAWPFIKQRPYGILADPDIIPKSIYVSSCCTAPLGVDFEFLLKNDKDSFQLGLDVLNTLVKEPINLSVDASFSGFLEKIKGVNILLVNGPHPAGNVSVQMQKHLPINMGEKVWEVRPEDVANIGKLFSSGEYSAQRTIAVAGSSVVQPQYIKTQIGAKISSLTSLTGVKDSSHNRYINGDVLSGMSESEHGYIPNAIAKGMHGRRYRKNGSTRNI
jgi:Na+-transporting NADH:ubiquinone oxidoreductase subunit A